MAVVIRPALPADAEAILKIYAPAVLHSHASFEEEVPAFEEMRERIARYGESHAWLVAEEDARLLGYAYGSPHRARAAYRFSAEVSAYVADFARGRGVGKALYRALFERLKEKGFHSLYAGIAFAKRRESGVAPRGRIPTSWNF